MEQNSKTTKYSGLVIKCAEIAKIVTLKKIYITFVCYAIRIINLNRIKSIYVANTW
jgi:hypothetical protein